jgi:hypothetical protein
MQKPAGTRLVVRERAVRLMFEGKQTSADSNLRHRVFGI